MATNIITTNPSLLLSATATFDSNNIDINTSGNNGGVDVSVMGGNGSVNMWQPGITINITSQPTSAALFEWIKGNGIAYINSGYIPNAETWYECKVKFASGNVPVFGSRLSDAATNVGLSIYGSYSYGFYYNHYEEMATPKTVPFVCKIASNGDIFIDNVFMYNTSGSFQSRDLPLHIFGMNYQGRNFLPSSHYLYYLKIYENERMVHHYVAAIDFNGVPCMYDNVNNNFIYNAAANCNFSVGNN